MATVVRRLLSTVGLLVALLAAAPSNASDVRMSGSIAYQTYGSAAVLTVARIDNYEYFGYSGTLRLELWASPTPYVGASQFGYKLAQYGTASGLTAA
jgi:hypothetical protein